MNLLVLAAWWNGPRLNEAICLALDSRSTPEVDYESRSLLQ